MRNIYLALFILAFSLKLSAGHVFSVKGEKTFLADREILVVELRCSNAIINDEATAGLIGHLDLYKSFGVNTISVFFMGSRFGDVIGYNEDASMNPVHQKRMRRKRYPIQYNGSQKTK